MLSQHCVSDVGSGNIIAALGIWQSAQSCGKKPATQKFYREIANTIRSNLPANAHSLTDQELSEFGSRVAHYCPSRWNLIVSAIRTVTGKPNALKYRKLRFRQFKPPTESQFAALLAECDKLRRSKVGLVVRFLSLTGLRIAEARALTWDNIGADYIDVPASISKNGLARYVPLLPGADQVLQRLRECSKGKSVLPFPNVRRGLEKACKRAGIPTLSYHCFRHIFATRCIESGVDLPTVARWLGHQDGGALLAKVYFHMLTEHSKRMAEKVKIAV